MTAPHKARVDFVTKFREEFPDRPREECIHAANLLLRNAATYARLEEESCNGHPIQQRCPPRGCDMATYNARASKLQDAWDNRITKQEAAVERRVKLICAAFDLPVTFGGDPRGFTIKLHFKSGAYNSWGGAEEGYGVPS